MNMRRNRLFAILLLLSFLALLQPRSSKADLILPTTGCEYQQDNFTIYGVNQHLTSGMSREGGTKAFRYGSGTDFVSADGTFIYLNANLLFAPIPETSIIKALAFDSACYPVFGFGTVFRNLNSGENTIKFDPATNQISLNEITRYPRVSGIIRYIWLEVWDGVTGSGNASYSYLVDITDLKNPTGSIPDPEPLGKRPVLIIPGIMGTEIFKGEEKLWPDVLRMIGTNNDPFMDFLAYTSDLVPADPTLKIGEVLGKPMFRFDYTERLINDFESQGYIKGINLFTFPYDWRKDLDTVATDELKQKIDDLLSQTGFNKIDIIAHSQGGLVIKRLLYDDADYESKINKLVFVGTPHLGAPKAAKALLYGDPMNIKFLELGLDPSKVQRISQNMPSIYELLPSLEYFGHGQEYLGAARTFGPLITGYSMLDYPETKQKLKDLGLNSALIDSAEAFHSEDYDNYDFNSSGIQAYNIMGCEEGTIDQILAGKNGRYWLGYGPGDKTVPFISASNVFGTSNYYARESSHGSMMTDDGTRQLILNLITGSSFEADEITQNPSECEYNGQAVSVHSPVDLHIYDENGNHVGPNATGNIDLDIPGAQYDVLGEDKFAFLPEGGRYMLKLIAIDNGSFDFYSSIIENGVTNTSFYNDVGINASSIATIALNETNSAAIHLDFDGDGIVDELISPSANLNSEQFADLINPATVASIDGIEGQSGFYRSSVEIGLSATDDNSGVLSTRYSLDGSEYQTYTMPLEVSNEGQHNLRFFSTDNTGNDEEAQIFNFTIDKTAPEISASFDPDKLDLVFSSSDSVADSDDMIIATDQAGNQTVLTLTEENRKKNLKAEVRSLSYNGQMVALNQTGFKFIWDFDKKTSQLKHLEQKAKSKENFNIEAAFKNGISTISGWDQNGKIKQDYPGLRLLEISTMLGDFTWGIAK